MAGRWLWDATHFDQIYNDKILFPAFGYRRLIKFDPSVKSKICLCKMMKKAWKVPDLHTEQTFLTTNMNKYFSHMQRYTLHLVSSTRPIFRHTNARSFLRRSLATQSNPEKPTLIQTPTAPLPTRVWKKVKHEAQHYWHGSKLLVSDVRIASKLQWKILHGDTLTRRERRQVSVCISHSSH